MSDVYPEAPTAGGARRVTTGSAAVTTTSSGEAIDLTETSVGQLVSRVTTDLSTLMRQELELAKTEVKAEAKQAGKSAGMLGGAAGAGYFAALFASLTVMFLLDLAMPLWVAALIVTAVYGIAAAVLYAKGRKTMKTVSPAPTQTVETLKEDVQWAKARSK